MPPFSCIHGNSRIQKHKSLHFHSSRPANSPPFLNPNLHLQFTQLAHKYGPVYKLWLGSQLSVVISSPSLIKEVVRDHDTIFANHDPSVAGIVATGGLDIVWSPYGKYWRDMRKLFAREMLSNNNLQASYGLRREEVRRVIGDIVNTKIGKPIEIGEFVFRTELNVIMSLLWGGLIDQEERDRLGAEFRVKISKVVDLMGKPNVSDFFPGLARFDFQGVERDMRSILPGLEQIFDSVIDARMKIMTAGDENKDESRKDFLGVLLELKEQEVGKTSSFGLTQIKAILLDMVIGATDTTSTTIEWVLAELLDNPGAMEKAQQELTHVVGMNNIVEESHISKLHYLEAVVKETFRLHPALPLLLPRMPNESRIIGGYTIPKDSKVFLNTWSIYRDPQVWEDPLQFKPDRFLNDDTGKFDYMGNNFEYLPFGSGRRMCPGLILGEKMVMYFVATLLHSFEWRLPEGKRVDLLEQFGIVMRRKTPLFAIPYQRLQSLDLSLSKDCFRLTTGSLLGQPIVLGLCVDGQ
ncbi:hypothetical protein DH2020_027613 [Rehmannia glutinosa]|uniref:Uncharacterized protein n=1 Tax=Rehmannia glutinosa TaxID=99300 RepID=A0ABR0VWN7_REHGL